AFAFVAEYLCHFFDLSSLALLTAISVERCISVLLPLWYQCHRPKHLSGIVCGVLWAFAGAFVSSTYFSVNIAEGYGTAFSIVEIAIFMILASVLLIFDLILCIKLRRHSHRRHLGKLNVVVLLNVIFFFVLGVPFSVEVFLDLPSSHMLIPEYSSFLLALLNSSVNPILYFLVGSCQQRRFQASVKVPFHSEVPTF
ncbi:PREDICTED: proto-oncogene Mas-like, partial [Buceros rhinoceros silvestris]|uniref:proto-oncogene Mas-like n=1 Tax=Buceros rhinoceros silvestris TaxID=175836 RepID=UPI000528955B